MWLRKMDCRRKESVGLGRERDRDDGIARKWKREIAELVIRPHRHFLDVWLRSNRDFLSFQLWHIN